MWYKFERDEDWKSPTKGYRLAGSLENLFLNLPFEQGLVCVITALEMNEPIFRIWAEKDEQTETYADLVHAVVKTLYESFEDSKNKDVIQYLDSVIGEVHQLTENPHPINDLLISSHLALSAIDNIPEATYHLFSASVLAINISKGREKMGPFIDAWWTRCRQRLAFKDVKTKVEYTNPYSQ